MIHLVCESFRAVGIPSEAEPTKYDQICFRSWNAEIMPRWGLCLPPSKNIHAREFASCIRAPPSLLVEPISCLMVGAFLSGEQDPGAFAWPFHGPLTFWISGYT